MQRSLIILEIKKMIWNIKENLLMSCVLLYNYERTDTENKKPKTEQELYFS